MPLNPRSPEKKVNGPYGRLQERAALALSSAIEQGATPLEAQIIFEVAAHPGSNWMTGKKLIARINQRTGSHHHSGSGRRAVRDAERKGLLGVTRVMPFSKPPGALYASAHGTTSKRVLWGKLRVRDPISKHELSRMRHEARSRSYYRTIESESPEGGLEKPPAPASSPHHGAMRALVPRDVMSCNSLYDEFASMAQGAIDASERRQVAREKAHDRAMLSSILAKGRAPPG